MAVAHPHLQQGWEKWKKVMEENRKRKLKERLSRWKNLEMYKEEEEEEEKEEEEERRKTLKERLSRWTKLEMYKEEEEEEDSEEEEGGEQEGEGEKKVQEKEREEDNEGERDAEDNKQVGVEEEREVTEELGGGKKGEVEEVTKAWEQGESEGASEGGSEGGSEGLNVETMTETEEIEDATKEKEEEQREQREAAERGEVGGEERDDEEEREDKGKREEEQKGTHAEMVGIGDERVMEQEGEVEEEIQPEVKKEVEEHGEEEEEEEEERVQQREEGNSSDSVDSEEDSPRMGSDDEGYNSERLNIEKQREEEPRRTDNEEDESEKMTNEEDSGSRGECQEDPEELLLEEDESSEEEEAEDVEKVYCKDHYPDDLFGTLTEFRDSSLLTDLTLSTEAGQKVQVHSPVLAAVSSHVRDSLRRRETENRKRDAEATWSMSLGPEVDSVGLEAVVEFAYSGSMSRLDRDTADRIKAAAETLCVPRVMDLCKEEETQRTGGQKKKDKVSAAEERKISLQSLNQLWVDSLGCDVTLESVGQSLQVHRVILAAGSDYFRGMFTSGMRESRQSTVTLPFLLASELELLVGCSYSGVLPLSWRCVFEMTSTALQLQYQPALSLCLNFLHGEIDPLSCLDVASFAEAYAMEQLLDAANDFVLRQFQKVACTSKFKDLPAEQLLKYLNSQSLCVPSELVVFKAVVAWIQAKPKKRLQLAKVLMKTVNFPLMTFKEFKEVQSLNIWSDQSLVELHEAVVEDFCSNGSAPYSQCRIYLPKESLVLIGGDQISEDTSTRSISRDLWFGNSLRNHTGIKKAMEWRRLGEMPDPGRFSHEVAMLNGQLYVFGGKRYYGISDTLDSVYRYDPLQSSWERLADMQQRRCLFSAVVLDGNIFSIGGHCDPEYIESVERYCPTANSWSFTCPLDLPLAGHVAKVLQGQILVSGGLNSDYGCLSSVFRYHPETGSTYLANMTQPRAKHCMETLGDRLYVAGGITTDESVSVVDLLTCEAYSPATDTWTALASLPVPHVGAGSAVLEAKFYVLGGYSQEDYGDTKMVHRYDPATQGWENMGKMPGPNNDIRATLLFVPPDLRL